MPRERPASTPIGKRYATLNELRDAVRVECIAEIERAGLVWTDAFDRAVQSIGESMRADRDAREVWRDVAAVLVRAKDFVTSRGATPTSSRYLAMLRVLFNPLDPGASTTSAFVDTWGSRLAEDKKSKAIEDLDPRSTLVLIHGQSVWWASGKPTARDLALLSLLAGNFPMRTVRQQHEAKARSDRPTVAQAIDAETRAMRQALSRLGPLPTPSEVEMREMAQTAAKHMSHENARARKR